MAEVVSIMEVAEEVATIETCAPVAARFAGGEAIRRCRERNPFLGWASTAATLRMWRMCDVVLDRSLMVLLKDGRVIAETNYLQSDADIAAARVRPEHLVRVDFGYPVATCFDHWDSNYYHWIAHTVPAVQAVLQRHSARRVGLVVPVLHAWQRRSLELIGASGLPFIATSPGAQYLFPVLEYYDYVAGRADFAVSALSGAAYGRIVAQVGAIPSDHRRLYIDRSGSHNRRLPNEEALITRLGQRGFHAIRPERFELEQQIALFQGADIVVGQLGAGLANIAFCRPGTVVYELVPEHHQNPCFLAMALQGGVEYWADLFPTGVAGGDHTTGWAAELNVEQVMRRLDELEALI